MEANGVIVLRLKIIEFGTYLFKAPDSKYVDPGAYGWLFTEYIGKFVGFSAKMGENGPLNTTHILKHTFWFSVCELSSQTCVKTYARVYMNNAKY